MYASKQNNTRNFIVQEDGWCERKIMYITYQKKGIKIGQIWFNDEISFDKIDEKMDIAFFHGIKEKQEGKNEVSQEFHTLISDLTEDEDKLYSVISKNVRYEIRKSKTDDVVLRTYQGKAILENEKILQDLGNMYQVMYQSKGMNSLFNYTQARQYAQKEALLITGVYQGDEPLVLHSYVLGDTEARLLHSVSDFRDIGLDANLIARSNKRLHWEDIQFLKQSGFTICDWGGVSSFENPNGIDTFKMKFGGNPMTYYNVFVGKSFLGKIGIKLLKLK